jgi:hypothetical protein
MSLISVVVRLTFEHQRVLFAIDRELYKMECAQKYKRYVMVTW